MKITRQQLRQIIKEELMREGLFDAPHDQQGTKPHDPGDPMMRKQGYDAMFQLMSKMPPTTLDLFQKAWEPYYNNLIEAFNNRDLDALKQATAEANEFVMPLRRKRNVANLLGKKTVREVPGDAYSRAESLWKPFSRWYEEKWMPLFDEVAASGDWCELQYEFESHMPKLFGYQFNMGMEPIEGCEERYGEWSEWIAKWGR